MMFEDPSFDQQADAVTEPASTPSPAPRESWPVLCLGIMLFASVLMLLWWRSNERTPQAPVQRAIAARMSTRIVEWTLYQRLSAQESPFATRPVDRQARQAAQQWEEVSRRTEQPREGALTLINAAALYGAGNDLTAARRSIEHAAARDTGNTAVYREILPLYQQSSKPVTLTADAERMLGEISAGSLIRARNAQVAGDRAAEKRALQPGARAGLRVLVVFGLVGIAVLGIIVTAIVLFLLTLTPTKRALREVRQPSTTPPPWNIGTALVVVSLHLIVWIGLLFLLALLVRPGNLHPMQAIIASTVTNLVSLFLVLGVFLLVQGKKPWAWRTFGWRRPTHSIWTVFPTLLYTLPLVWIATLITSRFADSDQGTNPIIGYLLGSDNPWLRFYLFVAAVVMAPLVEETLYRGVLFRALGAKLPFWGAAAISGVLFALVHGQLAAILPITVIGIALAFLVRRTESLWSSAVMHGVYNGLITGVLLLIAWATGTG